MFRDNEEPRNMLPEQIKVNMAPKMPEVPEVTLFSPSTQQVMPRKPTASKESHFVAPFKSRPLLMMQQPHHSVPDLTIYDNKKQPIQRHNFFKNNNVQHDQIRTKSKENHPNLATFQQPSVPDITMLDDIAPQKKSPTIINGVVFDASYKQYLKDSHDQFMKQIHEEPVTNPLPEHHTQKRSNIFQVGRKVNIYAENPLLKYAPKTNPQPIKSVEAPEKVFDANTSSILIDIDVPKTNGRILQPTKVSNGQSAMQEEDEILFKKVADMLKKMQNVVLSPTKIDQPEILENADTSEAQILKSIAFKYLSEDEIKFYNVESELKAQETKS